MAVYAPNSYWEASEEQRAKVCNGCGAKGGTKVPNTMWGLNIKQACNIHDWMFENGATLADFYFSNAVFIMNLALIIVGNGSKWLAPLRLARATKYFLAVQELGQDAYWVNNIRNNKMYISYKGSFK